MSGNIQRLIDQHVSSENSYVKSIQIMKETDDEVVVPTGYDIRFIECNMTKLTARDSAIHLYKTTVSEQLQLSTCIVSIDGGKIGGGEGTFMSTNSRINIKTLPASLAEDGSESEASVSCSLVFQNTESFWNKVKWESKGRKSTIVNSRLEFSDCTINSQAELEVSGTEWYILSGSCKFEGDFKIKELEALDGCDDPQQEVDDENKPSTNLMRGSAGSGPGCILQFKKVSSLSFKKGCEITGSEVNFYDCAGLSAEKELKYNNSSGFFSKCKINSQESCINITGTGNLYLTDSTVESQKTAITVKGPGSNCTLTDCSLSSQADCLSITSATLDLHSSSGAKSPLSFKSKEACITADLSTIIIMGGTTATFSAEGDTFKLKNGSTLESYQVSELSGEVVFNGEDSLFLIRGSNTISGKSAVAKGSGVLVFSP